MAVDWEQEHAYMAQALPTPTDTPYRTPSSSVSRLSARRRGSSPGPSSSPPPFSPEDHPDGEVNEDAMDPMNDEGISPLDPRRFTPTLHASLVSEILSLRRDLEGKSRIIDTLEVNLESSKSEAESLNETLSKHAKENRSLKRQLQLLEGGSMSAMTELSRERDEAVENVSDVKKRLEQSQKKNRSQEEEIHKTQILWDDDRQRWDEERRNLERKVHVVEGRLKVVLNEVAAAQAAGSFNRNPDAENDSLRDGAITRASDTTSLRSNSVLDRRRTSTASIGTYDGDGHNQRYSMLSLANGHGPKPEGLNLADELAFDEEEETDDEQDDERPETRSTMTDERPISVQSHAFEMNARKAVAVSLQGTQHFGPPALVDELRNLDSGHGSKTPKAPIFEYRDVGIQYTPPPSPKLHPETQTDDPHQEDITKPLTEEPSEDHTSVPENDTSMQDETAQHSAESSTETVPVDMVSSACQTTSELPSPPWTPKLEQSVTDYAPLDDSKAVTTQSSSTQTEDIVIVDKESEKEERPESPTQIPIPMIAIHPPGSNPPSPRNSVVLPPQTKSVSSQTDLPPRTEMCSSAMQTEEIRIDKRPTKLPSSLLPSALPDEPEGHDSPEISSQPPLPPYYAPPPKSARRKLRDPPPVNPPSNSSKGKEPEKIQAYPGNNDNGPLTENIEIKSEIRRPFRSSSLFAGFEQLSDDEWPDVSEEMFGDDEMLNRPMASYTLRSGKMVSRKPSSTVDESPLEEVDEQQHSPKSTTSKDQVASGSLQRTVARDRPSGKSAPRPLKLATSSKQPDIRRAAMISSSTAAHQSFRPRSPSAPSIGSLGSSNAPPQPQPPFPVPVRLSSRKIGASASEGAQSPTPYGSGQFSERMNGPRGRRPALRKVRSAAVVSRTNEPGRQRSRSPPTLSPSSAAPDSPLAPPMPFDEITAPRVKRSQQMRSSRPPLPKTYSTYSQSREEESNVASTQQTSVVDAIAQTMVGEWMWKYVRRRKSFGMPENNKDGWGMGRTTEEVSANITGNGVRHKRWVWLAPYERAVMWSSKQPTSGSALMGKSGRKLVIQSVLDVKDDNPMPKGALPQNQFNRSILILTPQRALKFTALTQERHFIWLTALSFLSHSSMSFNDLAALPPVPSEDYNPPPPAASLRRNPIRDSIRVAKGKNRPGPSSTRSFTAHPTSVREHPLDEDANESINDAADPPCVPRFSNNRTHTHTRKRSNTAPRLPPSAFRNFAQHAPAPSTYSTTTAGSSDLHSPTSTGPPGITSGRSSMSHRTSEASGPSNVGMTNFFDAVGTVRMEAFVDRTEMMPPRHQSRSGHRGRNGVNGSSRKKENGYMPYSPDHDYYRPDDASDVFYRHDDPFRGF